MKLYVSHGARRSGYSTWKPLQPSDWFIVEPRDDPMAQVRSLREAGRVVVEIDMDNPRDAHDRGTTPVGHRCVGCGQFIGPRTWQDSLHCSQCWSDEDNFL